MCGGHITDNWDRITNNAYLKILIKPELLTGCNLTKSLKSPDPNKFNYNAYMKYIIEKLLQNLLYYSIYILLPKFLIL